MDGRASKPVAATPNLTVDSKWHDCKVEVQQPNHFRIVNPGPLAREITWKTRGEKVPSEVLLQSVKANLGTPSEAPPALTKVAGVER